VQAALVEQARGPEGGLRQHVRPGRLVLVGALPGGGRAELRVDAEDLVDAAQVGGRVPGEVVDQQVVELPGGEAPPPRLQAAEVLAVAEDLRGAGAGVGETALAGQVALTPHVQVLRPGALDRVAQRDQQGRPGQQPLDALGRQRVGEVGGGDVADPSPAGVAAEVARVPLHAAVEVAVEEEDLVDGGGQVHLRVLPQALVEPVGAALGRADHQEVGQPAGGRLGHAGYSTASGRPGRTCIRRMWGASSAGPSGGTGAWPAR
jgi:hypothetical protein